MLILVTTRECVVVEYMTTFSGLFSLSRNWIKRAICNMVGLVIGCQLSLPTHFGCYDM